MQAFAFFACSLHNRVLPATDTKDASCYKQLASRLPPVIAVSSYCCFQLVLKTLVLKRPGKHKLRAVTAPGKEKGEGRA